MSRHTPGPWCVDGAVSGEPGVWSEVTGQIIALCPIGERDDEAEIPDGENDANAALIASAPELLAALRGLLDQVDVLIYRSEDEGVWDEAFIAARESARSAITHAEGREVRP